MADAPLIHTLLIVFAAVCAVGIATVLRLPASIGYVLAGIVIGAQPSMRALRSVGEGHAVDARA